MSAFNVLADGISDQRLKPPAALDGLRSASLDGIRKDAAYRVAWRKALAERTAGLLDNAEAGRDIRERILSAHDDKAAHAIARVAVVAQAERLEAEERDIRGKLGHLDRVRDAYLDLSDWIGGPLKLQSVEASQFHKVCGQNLLCVSMDIEFIPPEIEAAQTDKLGVFLVQHDWASLLTTADVDDGNYRLPFDLCCFEFSLSGRHICCLLACHEGEPYRLIPIIRVRGGWLILLSYAVNGADLTPEFAPGFEGKTEEARPELAHMLMAQVRAIAITLDAEVVVQEVVRAPHKLNAARLKRGERPIYDYHVLSRSPGSPAAVGKSRS